ncbi:hypothetical protein CN918_27505 [Priestia megaterium]|nr:hypothetical protein CN918_27505 [Priestia megaterium]
MENEKSLKKEFFFIVLPLLLIIYFVGFQKYTFTEEYTKKNAGYEQVLAAKKVSHQMIQKKNCSAKTKNECYKSFVYKASLPKHLYLKFYFFTFYE